MARRTAATAPITITSTPRGVDTLRLKEVWALVGGLSRPSKMPGYGYSLPAEECQTGSKLRVLPGTPCSGCYARKGRYVFPKVQAALYRRFRAIDHPLWVDAMVRLINHYSRKVGYFRWHDSGDIQSLAHLEAIARICALTPSVKHWLPTQERHYVLQARLWVAVQAVWEG